MTGESPFRQAMYVTAYVTAYNVTAYVTAYNVTAYVTAYVTVYVTAYECEPLLKLPTLRLKTSLEKEVLQKKQLEDKIEDLDDAGKRMGSRSREGKNTAQIPSITSPYITSQTIGLTVLSFMLDCSITDFLKPFFKGNNFADRERG